MKYAFEPEARTCIPVAGGDCLFPVRRIYCIGRNYADHAIEMGHDPQREPPFFFQKNPENLVTNGKFPLPRQSNDVHHEVEMAVCLKSGGRDIGPETALETVYGYGVALDMTCRDLQSSLKAAGRPWEIAKAFEKSAPISEVQPASTIGHPSTGTIGLKVNGTVRQSGDLSQMIWKVPDMIAYLSRYFEIAAGDVILTGTPAGVGPVERGDRLEARIDGIGRLSVEIV